MAASGAGRLGILVAMPLAAVKVRGGDFTTRSRSETALAATTDVAVLIDNRAAARDGRVAGRWSAADRGAVSLSGLTIAVQQSLFDESPHLSRPRVEPAGAITPRPPLLREGSRSVDGRAVGAVAGR
jgi:hypothetical protein